MVHYDGNIIAVDSTSLKVYSCFIKKRNVQIWMLKLVIFPQQVGFLIIRFILVC